MCTRICHGECDTWWQTRSMRCDKNRRSLEPPFFFNRNLTYSLTHSLTLLLTFRVFMQLEAICSPATIESDILPVFVDLLNDGEAEVCVCVCGCVCLCVYSLLLVSLSLSLSLLFSSLLLFALFHSFTLPFVCSFPTLSLSSQVRAIISKRLLEFCRKLPADSRPERISRLIIPRIKVGCFC